MTLLHSPHHRRIRDEVTPDPAVHVIAVGVGWYGTRLESRPEIPAAPHRLKPVEAVRASLQKFLEFILEEFECPNGPLGSVEVLFSDHTGNTELDLPGDIRVAVEEPTKENIHKAVRDWYNRANRNSRNVAIFYWVGHGLGVDELTPLVLVEDFPAVHQAEVDQNLFALNVRGLERGMRICAAKHQYFFVDACRNLPHALASELGDDAEGVSIITGRKNDKRDGREDLMVAFAVPDGNVALAHPKNGGYFTQALLRSFRANGQRQDPNVGWRVTTEFLADGIRKSITCLQSEDAKFRERSSSRAYVEIHPLRGRTVLHKSQKSPGARVVLACDPIHEADFVLKRNGCLSSSSRYATRGTHEWLTQTQFGHHIATAEVPSIGRTKHSDCLLDLDYLAWTINFV